MYHTTLRPAIAMIELIFALVIMGIALMSAPMLINTAVQSTTVALQQEGINEAASRVSMIMTYPWDEADTDNSCAIPPVLHVTHGDSALEMAANNRRVGVPVTTNSRTFVCGNRNDFNASAIGADANDNGTKDDMDDFTNTSLVLDISGSGGQDYLEQTTVSIATAISYKSDSPSSGTYDAASITFVPDAGVATTNIKGIDVNLTSTSSTSELQKTIVLHAFSCNIGGRAFEPKVIP